jgi:hypothetical protein
MESGFSPAEIDTSRPHPARMYDHYLGGKDNYPVDRDAVAKVLQRAPEVRDIARANRAFLQRTVRYLAGEEGIRQFLDVGTGIPTVGNVHEVAGEVAPDARVVYVDNDPIVNTHANALLGGHNTTGIVLADLRDPAAILDHPTTRGLLDFSQPVALLLIAILHFVADEDKPAEILSVLRGALPPGSFIAISHVTKDFRSQAAEGVADVYNTRATAPLALRSHLEISSFFEGCRLVEPGLVQVPLWRPDGPLPRNLDKLWMYGGVARVAD